MSPGSSKRPTGTVPKTKTSRKNSVPQEMVAPTRRDLQQHLNDFFASVAQRASKVENNRTPGEGTCFDLDNLSLPENTRSCWPVRPIPRRNFLQDTINDSHSLLNGPTQNQVSTNAAIGVVIPTTPNSSLHHQQQNHLNEQLLHHTHPIQISNVAATNSHFQQHPQQLHQLQQQQQHHHNLLQNIVFGRPNISPDFTSGTETTAALLSMRVPDGAPQHVIPNNFLHHHHTSLSATNTTATALSNSNNLVNNNVNVEDRLNQIQDCIRITASLINSIQTEKPNGPRPQSVSSIHTNTTAPNTPTYEELQTKLEASNRNMQHIKEQQQQLTRLQHAAKNQLQEMEQLRAQQGPLSFADNLTPDYNNVEDVQNDVTSLMNRMKALTEFIHNQNDLAASLGSDRPELLEEHTQLQKKLSDLKMKKEQMTNLVTELQSLNTQADNQFVSRDDQLSVAVAGTSNAVRERTLSPIDVLQNSKRFQEAPPGTLSTKRTNDILAALPPDAGDEDIEDAAAEAVADSILHDKITEINAMKNQLKRLQDMMETVKLIEIKNGDFVNDEEKTTTNSGHPQRDDEEREMAERVHVLHNMTKDLRQQAISLAAERDRLKDIKSEMVRRREYDSSEKNLKQQQQQHQHQHQQQQQETNLKAHDLEAEPEIRKKEFRSMVNNFNSHESARDKKSGSAEPTDSLFFSPVNWTQNKSPSATSSLKSAGKTDGQQPYSLSKKPAPSNCNQGKDSADSGAADVLNMSLEAGSLQSGSSRGFSVPLSLRNINAREGPYRKSSQDNSRVASLNNQSNPQYEISNDHHSPWYWHNNGYYNQNYNGARPQSPHCPHYHHGGDQYYCRSVCLPQFGGAGSNDSMLMQQFIQTQQMLINSISQCNQLLWDQQREINNLNSAVLLIQERFLNSSNSNLIEPVQPARAESVPPNVVCTNQTPYLPRAQSEQPNFTNFNQSPATSTAYPFRPYANTCQTSPLYRNTPPVTGRGLRGHNGRPVNQIYFENDHNQYPNAQNLSTTDETASALLNNDHAPIFLHPNNINNNNNNNSNHATSASNSNASINNLHHGATSSSVASSPSVLTSNITGPSNATNNVRVYNPSVSNTPAALNNQVAPGNRANNYWDNFRSYSRQNLLSSSSCKSNEDVCNSLSNVLSQNRDPITYQNHCSPTMAHNGRNPPPTQMTHNNLPVSGTNKYYMQLRNQINQQQQQQQQNTPDVLNVNQQQLQPHYQHDMLENNISNTNYNNINISPSSIGDNNPPYLICSSAPISSNVLDSSSISNYSNAINNISSYNFDINELKQPKMTMKILQKSATGGNKRIRQSRDRDNNNTGQSMCNTSDQRQRHDLNLASTTALRQDSKSSATKLFDDLKENVYSEVSALIAANETRPHFLINLFRELQLISTSDPLRKRLMEAFQELYSQYWDASNILITQEHQSQNQQNGAEHTHQDNIQSNTDYQASNEEIPVQCTSDLQNSTDEGLIALIRDYLTNEATEIGDAALQRIARMIIRYVNNSVTHMERNQKAQKYSISYDEVITNLYQFNRCSNDKFLESIENYVVDLLSSSSSSAQGTHNNSVDSERYFERRSENNFLDLTPKQDAVSDSKSNEVLSALRMKDEHINKLNTATASNSKVASLASAARAAAATTATSTAATSSIADVVATTTSHVQPQNAQVLSPLHTPLASNNTNNNKDLAEADQICTDELTAPILMENEANESLCSDNSIGAVGGLISSSSCQLPDLAKVTTNPSRIPSLEEDEQSAAAELVPTSIDLI